VRLGMTVDVTVDMGPATVTDESGLKVSAGGRSWPAVSVDVGNPHAVAFVDDLADAGELIEAPVTEPAFPDGVNVEFVTDRGERHIAMRVHERGVGETRSCGTGACAAMAAAARRAGDAGPTSYVVDVPGGRLTVSLRADGHVELTGPAVLVGDGELRQDWLLANR
jgi:diaminopimelate epimerase